MRRKRDIDYVRWKERYRNIYGKIAGVERRKVIEEIWGRDSVGGGE